MKKLTAIILTIILVISAMPTGVLAASDWTGYAAVSTKAQLNAVRNNTSGKYYLTNDIVFTAADFEQGGAFYNGGMGWEPIGTAGGFFGGVFDGNGYTVFGLKISSAAATFIGLFGYSNGEICNVGVANADMTTSAVNSYAGGIVGYNSGTISRCYNSGSVNSTASAGGIAGINSGGVIENCYNTGYVTATINAGGIAGINNYSGIIRLCYNAGSPLATTYGGIAGNNMTGAAGGTVSTCYYLGRTPRGVGSVADTVATVRCSIEEMKQQETFATFDFDDIWALEENGDYLFPTLAGLTHHDSVGTASAAFAGGNGTLFDPYLIATKAQLNNVRNHLRSAFRLANDIVLGAVDFSYGGAFYNGGEGWAPIGTADNIGFRGVFDGDGHVVSGLYINITGTATPYAGLFGYSEGIICNTGIVDSSLSISPASYYSYLYSGGIVGYNTGIVSGCYNTGSVSATTNSSYSYAGGIAGYSTGIVSGCYNTGSISATTNSSSYAGGIAGYSTGTVTGCYNTGSVSATTNSSYSYAGGIVGYNTKIVTNCYNTGSVSSSSSSSSRSGGITGYNSSPGTVSKCYNAGFAIATAPTMHIGAIVGENSNSNVNSISNCYHLNTVKQGIGTGQGTSTLCTSQEMQQQGTFVGFDFAGVWSMNSTQIYKFPQLQAVSHITFESISLVSPPAKTVYTEGDSFDPTGFMALALHSNNTFIGLSAEDCEFSGYDSAPGLKIITASCGGKTVTFTVTVNADTQYTVITSLLSGYIVKSGVDFISGVAEHTSPEIFLSNLSSNEGTLRLVNEDGDPVSGGVVGTGMKVQSLDADGNVKKEYTVVIYGDTDGDGQVNSPDLSLIKNHILGITSLTEGTPQHEAASIIAHKSGTAVPIGVPDLIAIKRHMVSAEEIK